MSNLQALSFLSATDPDYIADMYAKYLINPASVDSGWADIFTSLGDEGALFVRELKGASWQPPADKLAAVLSTPANLDLMATKEQKKASQPSTTAIDAQALLLIQAYRTHGHLQANLDPLGLTKKTAVPELDPASYGFSDADMDRKLTENRAFIPAGTPLKQVVSMLRETYCGTIGAEFTNLRDPAQRQWLRERFETGRGKTSFTAAEKKGFLKNLTQAEGFERFLDVKFTGAKRFGVDGSESSITALEEVISHAAKSGIEEVVLGMAHRGRLNVLTNIMSKPFVAMFSEFQGMSAKPDDVQGSGDVKYHMGYSSDREFDGKKVHLSLAANPSHLEFVNPIATGRVRAKQNIRHDIDKDRVAAILIHGDAALAGQGIVAETLMLSGLRGYSTGGTIHIVINNQIGFTTSPSYSRSGPYCTDIARMIDAPVFHVNGDDVEAVIRVVRLAAEYHKTFRQDIFIDIVGYRRYGHNESDEPAFTQPLMYKTIREKKSTREIYAQKLIAEGVLTPEESEQIYKDWNAFLEQEFKASATYKPNRADMLEGQWRGLKAVRTSEEGPQAETSVTAETLQKIGAALTAIPEGFSLNGKIARQLEAKKKMFETGEGVDWATAEALAFGSLVIEGHPVRLSGQDSGRGTFSHRHAVFTDQENEEKYIPLQHIDSKQAVFEVHDSPLSEAAVLGFEYGYSLADPKTLVLWEGQFGDFVNGAQVIIDQFISASESKWLRMSGLVMLLPHGFEGQGPEHSSARLERFLQASAEDNWRVVNCTTPANYFHVLRRQICHDFRKPLIVMTPKSLLRHKLCVSPLSRFTGEQRFHRVFADDLPVKDIRRVVICSGKVYYDLLEARTTKNITNVALVRLEQFYPFPEQRLAEQLEKYPNADVVWCQEEPANMGGWPFVAPLLEKTLAGIKHKTQRPVYAGRPESAAPATGSLKMHNKEQEALIHQALTL